MWHAQKFHCTAIVLNQKLFNEMSCRTLCNSQCAFCFSLFDGNSVASFVLSAYIECTVLYANIAHKRSLDFLETPELI